MQKMEVYKQFISWVKLFFGNAFALVNLNGSSHDTSKLKEELDKVATCPHVLDLTFLFLFFLFYCGRGSYSYDISSRNLGRGQVERSCSFGQEHTQCISQYADESSFMVRKDMQYVDELVMILEKHQRQRLTGRILVHTQRSLAHTGLTNTHTRMCGLRVMIGSGLRKGTYLNIMTFHLG